MTVVIDKHQWSGSLWRETNVCLRVGDFYVRAHCRQRLSDSLTREFLIDQETRVVLIMGRHINKMYDENGMLLCWIDNWISDEPVELSYQSYEEAVEAMITPGAVESVMMEHLL